MHEENMETPPSKDPGLGFDPVMTSLKGNSSSSTYHTSTTMPLNSLFSFTLGLLEFLELTAS